MKYYIDSEIILGRKIEPLVYVYIMIIIVITLSLIIFLTLFHYKTYYKIKGVVEERDENFYIRVYIPLDDTNYLLDNSIVRINRKEYKYKIIMIDSEYLSDNYNTYQAILLKIDMPSKYKFNNLNLDLQFLKEDKRVIDYIIRR